MIAYIPDSQFSGAYLYRDFSHARDLWPESATIQPDDTGELRVRLVDRERVIVEGSLIQIADREQLRVRILAHAVRLGWGRFKVDLWDARSSGCRYVCAFAGTGQDGGRCEIC